MQLDKRNFRITTEDHPVNQISINSTGVQIENQIEQELSSCSHQNSLLSRARLDVSLCIYRSPETGRWEQCTKCERHSLSGKNENVSHPDENNLRSSKKIREERDANISPTEEDPGENDEGEEKRDREHQKKRKEENSSNSNYQTQTNEEDSESSFRESRSSKNQ